MDQEPAIREATVKVSRCVFKIDRKISVKFLIILTNVSLHERITKRDISYKKVTFVIKYLLFFLSCITSGRNHVNLSLSIRFDCHDSCSYERVRCQLS